MKKLRPNFKKDKQYFEYYKIVNGKAVRDKPYFNPLGVQLYNIEKDKSENVNLAEKHPELVEELEGYYQEWRKGMDKPFRTFHKQKKVKKTPTKISK